MQIFDIVKIGDATLYHADCREVLPTLGKFDLLLADPPYGLGIDRKMAAVSGCKSGGMKAHKGDYLASGWDDDPLSSADAALLVSMCGVAILWGGNYYGLPGSQCWLVWDKQVNGNFAACELAWTNLKKPVQKFTWMWNGMLRQGGEERNGHPTQKPLALMAWCLDQVPAAKTVLDPFMGSGTTGVACAQSGRSFTGIERERKYFDIACERISRAYAQGKLFAPEIVKPQQAEITA